MKTRGAGLFATVIVVCLGSVALADGAVLVKTVIPGEVKARIPDQSALITFDGKTERLVIETAAESNASEFAWVVPVPAMPKVEKATTGLFPTLRMITRPRVASYERQSYIPTIVCLAAGILLWIGIFTRRWFDVLIVAVFLGIPLATLMPLSGRWAPFLDHLGRQASAAGSASERVSAVTVRERSIVGAYDTVTLSGTDGKAVTDWLKQNGFAIPGKALPVLDQYAKEGWVFVASLLRKEAGLPAVAGGAKRFTPHPLSFTFPTSRAVYPMRLTGIDNGPLTLDLYVAGDSEATAKSFARRRAARIDFDTTGKSRGYGDFDFVRSRPRADEYVPIFHEALQSYCKGFTGITLLSATLSPRQMKRDVYLGWKPLKPFRIVYHAREEVLWLMARWATVAFLACSIVCAWIFRCGRAVKPSVLARGLTPGRRLLAGSRAIGAGLRTKALPAFGVVLGAAGLAAAEMLVSNGHVWGGMTLFFAFVLLLEFSVYRLLRQPGQSSSAALPKSMTYGVLTVVLVSTLVGMSMAFPDAPHWVAGAIPFANSNIAKAIAVFVVLLLLFVLALHVVERRPASEAGSAPAIPPSGTARYALSCVAIVSVLVGLGLYLGIPTLPAGQIVASRWGSEILEHYAAHYTAATAAEVSISSDAKDAQDAIGALRAKVVSGLRHADSPLTGTRIHEEDSPGNFALEPLGGKPAYFRYDENGRKILLGTYSGSKFVPAAYRDGKWVPGD